MTLNATFLMRKDPDLKGRIESAAHGDPWNKSNQWVDQNFGNIIADQSWSEAWEKFRLEALSNGDEKPNIGVRGDVIDDQMILDAIKKVADAEDAQTQETTLSLESLQADLAALRAALESKGVI